MAKHLLLPLQRPIEQGLEPFQGQPRRGPRFRQPLQDPGLGVVAEGAAHAPRHGPGGVDFAAAEQFKNLLAELAQPDARAGQIGVGGHQAKEVAASRFALPAQQKIGTAEVKKGEGVGLADLGQIEQPPQFLGRRWNGEAQQLVARFRRSQQVTHRTDATNPGRDSGHLRKRMALAKLLEAPILHHMETGISEPPIPIQMEADLGVPFDPGHRINDHRAAPGWISHQPNLSIAAPTWIGRWPSSRGRSVAAMRSAEGGQPGR